MKLKPVLIVAMVLCTAIGLFAIAAEYGTQNDPLVSLSYINDVFAPDILKQAEKQSANIAKEVNANIASYEARVDKKINEFTDRNTASVNSSMIDQIASKVQIPEVKPSAPFATLNLNSGKTLVLSTGCEVLVRSGNVTCKTGSLIDTTTGGLTSAGGAVSANHLYIAPEAGATLTVKSNAVVLVKGQYSAY